MKCPYCGKQAKDLPDHLAKNRKTCGAEHARKLLAELDDVMKQQSVRYA